MLEEILALTATLLFLFFFLPVFHIWSNQLIIKLHFCNHMACMLYSLIWLSFTLISIYHMLEKRKKIKTNKEKSEKQDRWKGTALWVFVYAIVLVVGIVLMNLVVCDEYGKMRFLSGLEKIKVVGKEKDGGDKYKQTTKDGGDKYKQTTKETNETGHGSVLDDFVFVGRTCREFAELNEYRYWREGIIGYEKCRELAASSCGGISFIRNIEDSVEPTLLGREGEHIRGGSCCVWNCYEESFACEKYALEHDYENWAWINESTDPFLNCQQIALDECVGSVEKFTVKQLVTLPDFFCCVWSCEPTPELCTDNDNDYYYVEGGDCGPIDCDDTNPEINPGAAEICNGIDDNCDGNLLENENAHSTGVENCSDGFDNDCDGLVDCEDPVCECKVCIDSDDGINPTTPGTCIDETNHTDYCVDESNLMEWQCKNNVCTSEIWQCEKFCVETEDGGKCQ